MSNNNTLLQVIFRGPLVDSFEYFGFFGIIVQWYFERLTGVSDPEISNSDS